jgi:hypothetical protein
VSGAAGRRRAAIRGRSPHCALHAGYRPSASFDLDQRAASRVLYIVAAMSRCRIILAMLVALSVAMLPVAGSMAMPVGSPATVMSADMPMTHDMAMTDDMSDICPHQVNHPDGKPLHDAACIAACAAGHIAVPVDAASLVVFALLADRVSGPRVSNPYGSLPSSPPFRPPRA